MTRVRRLRAPAAAIDRASRGEIDDTIATPAVFDLDTEDLLGEPTPDGPEAAVARAEALDAEGRRIGLRAAAAIKRRLAARHRPTATSTR